MFINHAIAGIIDTFLLFLDRAGDEGIEPSITVLETVVIPFHQSPVGLVYLT